MHRFNGQSQWVVNHWSSGSGSCQNTTCTWYKLADYPRASRSQKKSFMRKTKTPGSGELNNHVSFSISEWLKEQVLAKHIYYMTSVLTSFTVVLSTAFHSRLERISAKSRPQDDPGRRRRAIWKSAQTGTLERNWKNFQLFAVCFAVRWRRNESL